MNFLKKLSCLLIAVSMILPYTAFAENNEEYVEAELSDIYMLGMEDVSLQSSYALSPRESELLEYIVSQYALHPDSIDIPEDYQILKERFSDVYMNYAGRLMQWEHPEIFSIPSVTGLMLNHHNRVTKLYLKYDNSVEDIEAAQAEIADEVQGIASRTKGMTELEKVLFVHDYIVSHYEYDNSYESRTLDTMVHLKKGVCQGYSYLFKAVMDELGIECVTVPADELTHMWNKVKVNGKWYNIDLTYDDPVYDSDADIPDKSISVSHAYFLVNDEEIKALDPSIKSQLGVETSCHITWNEYKWNGEDAERSDSDTTEFYGLHIINGATAYKDGSFWCVDDQNNICMIKFEGNTVLEPKYTLSRDFRWYAYGYAPFGADYGYYDGYYFSSVVEYNNSLYFNSANTVYRYDPEGNALNAVYEYDGGDISKTYFVGLRVKDDTLFAEYTEDVNGRITLHEVTIDETEPPAEPTATPEFPVFDNPLPCTVEANVETVTVEVENEEGEPETVEAKQVTITVDIPDEVTEAVEEVKNTVTVKVAKYSDGAFMGFEDVELDAGNSATFTAGDDCSSVKTFVWAGFIMPLAMAEELNLASAK